MHPSLLPGLRLATPLVVLVDDTRAFRDRRPHLQVRRGHDAVELLHAVGDRHIDELWLDYDLFGGTTSVAAVDHLVARAEHGNGLRVNVIEVHSARLPEALHITQRLRRAGYRARRCHVQGIWTRFDPALHDEWRPSADARIAEHPTARRSNATGLTDVTEGFRA